MTTANESGRGDIEDLLPWHAAGTLSPRDAHRVETALAADPELARRYELVREELAQTIHLNETLGAPSARAAETLFAKIDAEPARAPAFSANSRGTHPRLFCRAFPAHGCLVGCRSSARYCIAGRRDRRRPREWE